MKIFKFLTSNIGVKILALIFALSLWIYVVGVSDRVGQVPFKLPIEAKNIPQGLVLASDLGEAELKIKAPYYSWERLRAEDFSCFVDLAFFSPGRYELEVKISSQDPEISILEKKPSKVIVQLDPLSSKKIKVEVKIEGQPQEGFIVVGSEVEPSEVEIRGAESVLENILSAQTVIYLNGEMGKIEREVPLSLPPPYSDKVKNLTLDPSSAKVTVLIQKATNLKTVGIKVNISGQISPAFWISKIITEPATLTVRGKPTTLTELEYLETESINVSTLSSNLIRKVRLRLPEGITLVGHQDIVEVRIYLASELTTRSIPASLHYKNRPGSSSQIVKVNLSGPLILLSSLSSKNVILEIDLADRSPGPNEINLKKEMISVPKGVEIIDFSPKTIIVDVS